MAVWGVACGYFGGLRGGAIPQRYDLRKLGWHLQEHGQVGARPALPQLACYADLSLGRWLALAGAAWPERRLMLLVGVDAPGERARLLRLGFGDALSSESSLHEIEVRALRVVDQAAVLPRHRQLGALTLDLVARDAFVAGRAVGLHPREFGLLWRLAESPGVPVRPEALLADVWRLSFRPETNTLAVHVSRLRAKLRLAGVDGLIRTGGDGSYCVVVGRAVALPAIGLQERFGQFGLDDHVRLGKERSRDRMQASQAAEQEDNDHAA